MILVSCYELGPKWLGCYTHVLILHMQANLLVHAWSLSLISHWSSASFRVFTALLSMVFSCIDPLSHIWLLTMTLVKSVVLILVIPSLAMASPLATIWFHSLQNCNTVSRSSAKAEYRIISILLLRLPGYSNCWKNYIVQSGWTLLSIVTTSLLFICWQTMCNINTPNTLKSICTLYVTRSLWELPVFFMCQPPRSMGYVGLSACSLVSPSTVLPLWLWGDVRVLTDYIFHIIDCHIYQDTFSR
jgi:hypothetical protein